jgi:hypothetical protein
LSGFVLQEGIASFSLRVANLNLGFIGFEKNLIKKWVLLVFRRYSLSFVEVAGFANSKSIDLCF